MLKITTVIILLFAAGAIITHARYQPVFNELDRIEAEIEAYRQSAVVGYWRVDRVTKGLYFEEAGLASEPIIRK